MAFGIESYKKMVIPVPEDEEVLFVPRTMLWTGEWKDAICVLTDKGIHFRVRKDKMIMVDYSGGAMDHSLLSNTFLAYDRMVACKQNTMLFISVCDIQMVDGLKLRFRFHKSMDETMKILAEKVQPDMPRNLEPYRYSSHKPEAVPHKDIPAAR